ncbi:MAG: glycerol-3-phosphate 1-O-acyltransferase PlsY [Abditibacteriales bacterium]|nr:glycerol-3-phosphate 1-O-acyltransferase PlsY [Abditibacteriales bacterium]MDW8366071.1 glycerol-3-phosphate 1-O-acyltransferase PlsY [Abditibacteriales bacterium]
MLSLIVLLACYLLGSVPIGWMVGKVTRGVDIRQFGSGNIGFTNALRTLGWGPAVAVLIADVAKGVAAVLLTRALMGEEAWAVWGGVCAVAGHNWSAFLRFRGGRGVATSLGVILGLAPLVALSAFAVWLVVLAVSRYVSLASLIAAASVPLWMFVFNHTMTLKVISLLLCTFIVVRHIPNIKRLLAGTEHKWGQKVDVKAEEQKSDASETVTSNQ